MPSLLPLSLAFLAVIIALTRPALAFRCCIFLLPWQGLELDVGLRLTAYRLLAAALLAAWFVRAAVTGVQVGPAWFSKRILLYWAVATAITVVALPLLPTGESFGGALRSPVPRALAQVFRLGIALSPALVYWSMPRLAIMPRDAMRTYLASIVVLSLVGWGQLGVWYATGRNPLPIGLLSAIGREGFEPYTGQFALGEIRVYRMNSLGGEPRHLGQALAVALLLIQVLAGTGPGPSLRRKLLATWVFLSITLAMTYATSAAALWATGTLTLALVRRSPLIPKGMRPLLLAAPGRVALPAVALLGLSWIGATVLVRQVIPALSVSALLSRRTVERRLTDDLDFEGAIARALASSPGRLVVGWGLGNAHLAAREHLDERARQYALDTPFVAKTGILRSISETGLVGLLLLLGLGRALLRRLRFAGQEDGRLLLRAAGVQAVATLLVGYLLVSSLEETLIAAWALAAVAATVPDRVRGGERFRAIAALPGATPTTMASRREVPS